MEEVPSWAVKLIEDIGALKGTTEQILEQTKKTNGRVTKLEERVNDIESKNDTAAGAKSVWVSIRQYGWEIGKLAIASGLGFFIGGKK